MRVNPNNFGLMATASAAPAIVGSWHIDLADFKAVVTFMEDGTYFEAVDAIGDSAHTGIEWGNYSWNEITGEVTATSLGDTNGNWGLANDVSGPIYMSISGNTATFTQPGCSDCETVADRVLHPAGSIVGTWLFPPDVGSITFFADGSYIHGEEGHNGGLSGVERGTYSWDSVTGEMHVTSIVTDTNGWSGLSGGLDGGLIIANLNANGNLSFFVADEGSYELVAGPEPDPAQFITGTPVNDTLTGGAGVFIDGLGGIDTVAYTSSYSPIIHNQDGTWTVGTDILTNIERLQFADKKIAIDLTPDGHAGQAMGFIGTIAPALLTDTAIRGLIISMFDQGSTMEQLCSLALGFNLVPHSTSAELANAVYQNVIGGTPAQDMTNALMSYIDTYGQANFLGTVAGLHINVDLVGMQQTGIEFV